MGTITMSVQQSMDRFRQKEKKLDKLIQQQWDDAADNFRGRDEKYCTSELRVPAVVQPQTEDDVASPALTTFGELMECLDIVTGTSQMVQATTGSGSSKIRLGSGKPQSNTNIAGLTPSAEPNFSPFLLAKPVELVSFYPCI